MLFNGGRWEGTTFDWLAHFWAQGGELVDDSGKPIFGEGENREKMLKALNFFKDLVDSGAAPKRVATIKTYDDFNAAAIAGTAAMFIGGHWQNFQLKEAMPPEAVRQMGGLAELPARRPTSARPAPAAGPSPRFSDDPEKIKLCMRPHARGLHGPGQRGDGPAADAQVAVREPASVPGSRSSRSSTSTWSTARPGPGVPIYPEISNQIQIMMGEVLSGAKEPEAALDDAWAARQ